MTTSRPGCGLARGLDTCLIHKLEVGEHLFDLGRMVAMVLLGLQGPERGIGEYGVVTPDRNSSSWPQAALRLRSLTRRTISRAVMAWSFFEVKAGYSTSATSASEIQQPSWSSQITRGYLMGVQAVSGMPAIAS